MYGDGFELRPRPGASEAAAVQLVLARAGLVDALRPDPYGIAWRAAGLREAAGYDTEEALNPTRTVTDTAGTRT